MLAVVWLDEAIADLIDIVTFIAAENPGAARRIKSHLESAPLPPIRTFPTPIEFSTDPKALLFRSVCF